MFRGRGTAWCGSLARKGSWIPGRSDGTSAAFPASDNHATPSKVSFFFLKFSFNCHSMFLFRWIGCTDCWAKPWNCRKNAVRTTMWRLRLLLRTSPFSPIIYVQGIYFRLIWTLSSQFNWFVLSIEQRAATIGNCTSTHWSLRRSLVLSFFTRRFQISHRFQGHNCYDLECRPGKMIKWTIWMKQ